MTKININVENRGFRNHPDLGFWGFGEQNIPSYSAGKNALSFNKISLAVQCFNKSEKISCLIDENSYSNIKADQVALRKHASEAMISQIDKILVLNLGEKTVFIEPYSKLKNEALLFGFPQDAFNLSSVSIDSPQVQLNINTDFAGLNVQPIEFGKIIDINSYDY